MRLTGQSRICCVRADGATCSDPTPLRASCARWQGLEQALAELRLLGVRDTVERLWHALGGPATLIDARSLEEAEAFFEVLADAERRDGPALDLAALAQALERLYAPTLPDPKVRIELSTIHKAKGLQFDTVIVPGLERLPRDDERRLLRWTTQIAADHVDLVVAPLAQAGDEPNPLYEWLKRQERERLLQERRRLLYVAATRAQRWLHLIGSCSLCEGEGGAVLDPPPASMLGMLWPVVAGEFTAQLVHGGAPPDGTRRGTGARSTVALAAAGLATAGAAARAARGCQGCDTPCRYACRGVRLGVADCPSRRYRRAPRAAAPRRARATGGIRRRVVAAAFLRRAR